MSLTREELNKIIQSSNFDQLIGEVESEWFECKSQPYGLNEDRGKRELAKDVSSFLNVQGGVIVIGIKTKTSTIHFGDEIEEIHPFAQNLVNTSQYEAIIKTWIYPEVKDIEIVWIPTQSDSTKGITIIKIPNQKNSDKPFLITKTLDENKRVETIFGYVERKGDNSKPLTVIDLQKALKTGLNYDELVEKRFNEMEVLLKEAIKQKPTQLGEAIGEKIIEIKIKQTLEVNGLNKKRNITLSAYPNNQTELKSIFLSTDASIKRSLENPPTIRRSGWGLETFGQAKIIRGEMIQITNSDKTISLYRDGSIIFSCLADHGFLAWGGSSEIEKINPIAIVELVLNFVNFYKLVIDDFESSSEMVTFVVNLDNLHLGDIKSTLAPYGLGNFDNMFNTGHGVKEAPDNSKSIVLTVPVQNFNIEYTAYKILKEIYLWFGHEEDKIPYTKEVDGIKMIDTEAIKNAK